MRLGTRLCLVAILVISLTNFAFPNISTSFPSLSIAAYAQTSRAFGGNQLPNSTDLGIPSDNSTGLGSSSDNSTDLSALSPDNSTDLAAALGDNSSSTGTQAASPASGATVPEFGPISLAVLVISIMSIIVISSRTRLRLS